MAAVDGDPGASAIGMSANFRCVVSEGSRPHSGVRSHRAGQGRAASKTTEQFARGMPMREPRAACPARTSAVYGADPSWTSVLRRRRRDVLGVPRCPPIGCVLRSPNVRRYCSPAGDGHTALPRCHGTAPELGPCPTLCARHCRRRHRRGRRVRQARHRPVRFQVPPQAQAAPLIVSAARPAPHPKRAASALGPFSPGHRATHWPLDAAWPTRPGS